MGLDSVDSRDAHDHAFDLLGIPFPGYFAVQQCDVAFDHDVHVRDVEPL